MAAGAIIISFSIPLAVFGLALLCDRFERFVAAKLADESRDHGAEGDWPAIPAEFDVFHNATTGTGAQRDHA